MQSDDSPRLLRISEAAVRLSVSAPTVYRLVGSGALPALRVGGSLRIDADELAEYLYGEPSRGG